MRFVPNAISTKIARQSLVMAKHAPNAFFGVGIVGVVATAVLASRATLQVEEVLAHHEVQLNKVKQASNLDIPEYDSDKASRDKVLVFVQTGFAIAKLYAPAIGVGFISIAALTKSHNMLNERNVALTAAYAAVDQGYKKYRQRVIDTFGEAKERELRYENEEKETLEETKQGPKVTVSKHVKPTDGHSIYARFFDELNPSWQRNADYNFTFLRARQNYANDLLTAKGHLFLNEVYDMLGIERTPAGQMVGWVRGNGDDYVDFGLYADNPAARDFVAGRENSILLDFNVDGVVFELI